MLPVYIIVIVQAPSICILSYSPPWPTQALTTRRGFLHQIKFWFNIHIQMRDSVLLFWPIHNSFKYYIQVKRIIYLFKVIRFVVFDNLQLQICQKEKCNEAMNCNDKSKLNRSFRRVICVQCFSWIQAEFLRAQGKSGKTDWAGPQWYK